MGIEEKCLGCEKCIRVFNDCYGMQEVEEKGGKLIQNGPNKLGIYRDLYCVDDNCKIFRRLTGFDMNFVKKLYYRVVSLVRKL